MTLGGAVGILRRLGDVESVAGHAIAHNLRQNRRTPLQGEAQFFQDEDARAFTDDEPIAIAVEGPAGPLPARRCGWKEPAWPRTLPRPWA